MVATPIGNLDDLSPRALETLRAVDAIACEDTRHTRKLLSHFGFRTPLVSYHEHNEQDRAEELGRMLAEGRSVAVVSDAGTPGISDPSFRIVERAVEIGARVIPIPGPAAFVAAAIVSGLPTDSLFFGGFLPSKSGDRRRRLEETKAVPATLVFYESPHRIARSLADCLQVLGPRRAALAREITKLHEEIVRGTLAELIVRVGESPPKGELVLVIDRGVPGEDRGDTESGSIEERYRALELLGHDRKAALKLLARETGMKRSEVYRRLNLKSD